MDFETLTSHNALEKIKCDKCANYLSFFPIYTSPSYRNLCGRCVPKNLEDVRRNEAYEAVSQFLKFPCRYKANGCCDEMLPKNVPSHEETCPYKTIRCPVVKSSDCEWKGPLPEVLQHCHDKHFGQILTEDEFEIDLANSHQAENLIEFDDILLLVLRKFEASDNTLEYAVCHIEDEVNIKNCSCEIRIRRGRRNISEEIEATTFHERNATKIFLGSLESVSSVFGKITFSKTRPSETCPETGKTNNEMLAVIKCSYCGQYAIPPIYHCSSDHSILTCPECLETHLSVCQICPENPHETKNISLNKIASWLNYPCRFEAEGCDFVAKPELVKQHQRMCQYGPQDCPVREFVECDWSGLRKNVTQHVLDEHQDVISNLGEYSFSVPSEEARVAVRRSLTNRSLHRRRVIHCKIIQFANHLFRLTFSKTSQHFCWKVQIIGCFDKNFKYEIEVMDVNENGRRLVMRQICSTFHEKEVYCSNQECCRFDTDQIEAFVSDRILMYKVNIFK